MLLIFLFRIRKFVGYVLFSMNGKGHGIHSPFVFNLVSRVLRNKIDPSIVSSIETIRKKLIRDPRQIRINDLGAGLSKMNKDYRTVSHLSRHSPVSAKYGKLLACMASEFGKNKITELGTSVGISTMYMALQCRESEIITIEGSTEIAEIARENFRNAGITNIIVRSGSFDDALPEVINGNSLPGLVFIDGDHRKEPLLRYFRHIEGFAGNETVIIIDDINYSPEMESAWNEIRNSEKVTVSIDLFRMGIIFFRKGIPKSDYMIRY